jgi:uncharacterized protein (DUF885 family)
MDIEEINDILDREITENRKVLMHEAQIIDLEFSRSRNKKYMWKGIFQKIPLPTINRNDTLKIYEEEIKKMTEHLIDQDLVKPDLVESCPVSVLQTPEYLSTIRTGASYSITPRCNSIGGTLYIPVYSNYEVWQTSIRDYRMTCAHETYPGHHLLDSSRWSLTKPTRRVIEQPLFYEGWACFAEELMSLTHYFNSPYDRFLLAKRRLAHAIRGKVDIGTQTGKMDTKEATSYLREIDISERQAKVLIQKYALNPGYQVCYTIGLHKFLNLYNCYGRKKLPQFVQTVLGQGEIVFDDLERILRVQDLHDK